MNTRLRYFLISLVALSALSALALFTLQRLQLQADIDNLRIEQSLEADVAARTLQRHLAIAMRDIRFFATHPHLQTLMESRVPEEAVPFAQEVIAFAQVSAIYDQLRWIDQEGQERLRVNYLPAQERAEQVPEAALQFKGDRSYFTESVGLAPGSLYVSSLDLNIENDMIEQPFKPMLRFAMPVFNAQGESRGIFILNYLASILLRDFAILASSSPRHIYLLNGDGYWLSGPVAEEEWGFMFGRPPALVRDEPVLWEQMQERNEGEWVNPTGLWAWRTLDPSAILNLDEPLFERGELVNRSHEQWKVLVHTPPSHLQSVKQQIDNRILRVSILVLGALIGMSMYLAGVLKSRALAWQNLKNLATHDGMTGLMNHRHFMDKLNTYWEAWRRRPDIPISLVMLDLDHFKRVNDTYGHAAGDDVLTRFAQIIRADLRQSDVAGRLGGEEFCVMLYDCDVRGVRVFAERIRHLVEQEVFVHGGQTIRITVSLGAAMFRSSDAKPHEALERADQALYSAKQNGRNRLELDTASAA